MYCTCFGFTEKPFNITPDPAFIFLSGNHQEAFAHLLYGIDNHVGFIELTGEVGTGKTTILRTLLNHLDTISYRTAIIFNPSLSSSGLLQSINREFGIPFQNLNDQDLIDTLNQFLVRQNAAGSTVVLVIDEAQNLKQEVLEQIRLISNLETERDKLIQIVLAGQPELKQLLEKPELRQLNQRIMVRYHLLAMDFKDTRDYINHRLNVAGLKFFDTFSPGALKKIFRFSGGYPRLINILCDRALLLAYTKGVRVISSAMAGTAIKDIRKTEKTCISPLLFYSGGIILALLVLAALISGVPQKITGRTDLSNIISVPVGQQDKEADFSGVLRKAMSGMTENESAILGINALAKLWQVPPYLSANSEKSPLDMNRLASEMLLQYSRFNGSLGALVRINYPALLELTIPGVAGKRYLALTGVANNRYFVSPVVHGRNFITSAELESVWSGRCYLIWKNFLNIPPGLKDGVKGEAVGRLQSLLKAAGVYRGDETGIFDKDTIAAIKSFQTDQGMEPDGLAGKQTLLLLYRSAGGFQSPELAKRERLRKG